MIEERAQRVKSEPALERRTSELLLTVRRDQRGVEVHDQRVRSSSSLIRRVVPGRSPRHRAGGLARCRDRGQDPAGVTRERGDRARDRGLGRDATVDPGSDRITAASERQSPPNASVTARSVSTFPGSCTASGLRQGDNPSRRAWLSPVTSAVVVSSTPPAEPTAATGAASTRTQG